MKIKVGSTKYDLIITSEIEPMNGEELILGETDYLNGKISVCSGYSKQVTEQTFWHEIVHAVLNELGASSLNEDEGFVDAFGKQLYAFMNENNVDKVFKVLESKEKQM